MEQEKKHEEDRPETAEPSGAEELSEIGLS
jgi:hypothetical protein